MRASSGCRCSTSGSARVRGSLRTPGISSAASAAPGRAAGSVGPVSVGQPLAGAGGEDVLLTGADVQAHLLAGLRRTTGVDAGDDLLGEATVHVLGQVLVEQRGVDVGVRAQLLHEVDPGAEALAVAGELQRLGAEAERDGGVRAR